MADDEESTVASYRTAQFEAVSSSSEYDGEERFVMREGIGDRRLKKEERGIKRKKRASDDEPEEYPTNANSIFALMFNQMATEGTGAAGLEDVRLQTSANEVLRIAKLVSAALFAYDQDDFEREFLKDWNYDKKDMDLLLTAVNRLKKAYYKAESAQQCSRTTPFHPANIPSSSTSSSYSAGSAQWNELEKDDTTRKTAAIKAKMLQDEYQRVVTERKHTMRRQAERFYMLMTPPTDDEREDEEVSESERFLAIQRELLRQRRQQQQQRQRQRQQQRQQQQQYDSFTFRGPVPNPSRSRRQPLQGESSIFRVPIHYKNTRRLRGGPPLRQAAILARLRERQQRLTRGGFGSAAESSYSSSSADDIDDSNYEPSDFVADSDVDELLPPRLRETVIVLDNGF